MIAILIVIIFLVHSQQSYDQLRLDHDKLQKQLQRSRAENSILDETNRDLRQAIVLIEDEKTRCLEEVEKLRQDKHTLQEEKAALIREKELSTVCMLYDNINYDL